MTAPWLEAPAFAFICDAQPIQAGAHGQDGAATDGRT